jgi:hypothetical protein
MGIQFKLNCFFLVLEYYIIFYVTGLFLQAYEANFLRGGGFKEKKRLKISPNSNSSFPCIDNVLSLNISCFSDYLPLIYPNEIDVQDTSYLDVYIEVDNGVKLKTKLYDTLDDFTFPI